MPLVPIASILRRLVWLDRRRMGIVAEGVETEKQMEALAAAGWIHLQGYLFSKPVPAREVGALLAAGAGAGSSRASASQI